MKKSAAIKVFGNEYRIAQALGINQSAVSRWGRIVPELSARRLADKSDGRLVFDPAQYAKGAAA